MDKLQKRFKEVWIEDFEFIAGDGNIPRPICYVATELFTGRTHRIWLEDTQTPCPIPICMDVLHIAYYSSAEWGCYLALGWQLPECVLDLYPEYRILTNGVYNHEKAGLLNACAHLGIPTISQSYKDTMRDRILFESPYTEQEKQEILIYCETDVVETLSLLRKMMPKISLPGAIYRGEYMKAIAYMEHWGIPIDTDILTKLVGNWEKIQDELIERVNQKYKVYENRIFKTARFKEYLYREGLIWPLTPKGNLRLDDDTFKEIAKVYPQLQELRDLRYILGQMKLNKLQVGADGRNRCMLSPFRTKTGRNAPSTNAFIFGPAVWLRSLIKPQQGKVLAYIDFSQQEFFIAAVLSKDKNMIEAYRSGDPYLSLAKLVGAVPQEATKESHKAVRDQFKTCVLGIQYGIGAQALSVQIQQPLAEAENLIMYHKKAFRDYWKWLDRVIDSTVLGGRVNTVYGWQMATPYGGNKSARTIANFPTQATGAEILRVACILLMQKGIRIIAPIHDAILIECDEEEADHIIKAAQDLMTDASETVLGEGYRIQTEVDVIRYPDRYTDPRGTTTWNLMMSILEELD